MTTASVLRIEGELASPCEFSLDDLRQLDPVWQVKDVTRLGARRGGDAVRLAGLLAAVGSREAVTHLGLHGSRDDFHASIPLQPVKESAIIIYQRDGQPLDVAAGGPFRFFIPNHSACHTSEIDECANVKFLDRIELTVGKGYDNRPQDDEEHAKLHEQEE
ncbi:MAG: molybdopterin-dependent oxidoreductase [Pirellulaceae bacterium]|nr:molybdopterin-dependent oxidoreductase [Pirellulaceae bacterium]